MIITSYDPEEDTLYVRFAPASVRSARAEQVAPHVTHDYDEDGRLIAIQVLNVRQRLPADAERPSQALAARELPSHGWVMAASA